MAAQNGYKELNDWKRNRLHYFRPQTRVTLHGVCFAFAQDGAQLLSKAGFYGEIVDLNFDNKNWFTILRVRLRPRNDVYFKYLSEYSRRNALDGLRAFKNDGDWFVDVKVDYYDLENAWVSRGARCKEYCKKDCKKHALEKIEIIKFTQS